MTIQRLPSTLDYRDEAEPTVVAALKRSTDLSSGSEELAAKADSWAATYHLSPQRHLLLQPFDFAGERVLEVGSGCGALTRYLLEQEARVVAVEGNPARAEATALRCADIEQVTARLEIYAGDFQELPELEPFDTVLCVGVLEYATTPEGGSRSPHEFVEALMARLAPRGRLILAIENQLGLQYLLGHDEDHHGTPYVGLEGYPDPAGPRTFSRRELSRLLESAGASHQQWYYPFPDYKLPKVILTQQLVQSEGGEGISRQLVRSPVAKPGSERFISAEASAVFDTFVNAGLTEDIANSFLVCASLEAREPNALAWLFDAGRRSRYRRIRTLERSDEGLEIVESPLAGSTTGETELWLEHSRHPRILYVPGPSLESLCLEALRSSNLDSLRSLLRKWVGILNDRSFTTTEGETEHPYAPRGDQRGLPPEMFDAVLANFIADGDDLRQIDREWKIAPCVALDAILRRGLWYLALQVVLGGVRHPWDATHSTRQIAEELARLAGIETRSGDWDRMLKEEVQVQAVISGDQPSAIEERLLWIDEGSAARDQHKMAQRISRLVEASRGIESVTARWEEERSALTHRLAVQRGQLDGARKVIEAHESKQEQLEDGIESLKGQLAAKTRHATELSEYLVEAEKVIEARLEDIEKLCEERNTAVDSLHIARETAHSVQQELAEQAQRTTSAERRAKLLSATLQTVTNAAQRTPAASPRSLLRRAVRKLTRSRQSSIDAGEVPTQAALFEASLIVCTRNRSEQLAVALQRTLDGLESNVDWELIIVDNGSTDDTHQVANDVAARHPDRVRVCVEPELGLSAARNAGIRAAASDLLLFIDDDAYPESRWLDALVDALRQPGVDVVGGPIEPEYRGALPSWFDDRFLPYLSAWDLGSSMVELTYNEYPRGTNFACRRDVAFRYGGFSHHLGRRGGSLLSCEETELCLRVERGGGKILYIPEGGVHHEVDARRLTPEWLAQRFYSQGESEAVLAWMHGGRRAMKQLRQRLESAIRHERSTCDIVKACHRAQMRGYSRGQLLAPLRVPRYQAASAHRDWRELL